MEGREPVTPSPSGACTAAGLFFLAGRRPEAQMEGAGGQLRSRQPACLSQPLTPTSPLCQRPCFCLSWWGGWGSRGVAQGLK